MSHFTKVRTTLTDQETLVKALRKLGFGDTESHREPQPLYGYEGRQRPERAHVIVRRADIGRLSNDIGFVRRTPDGPFEAVISDYDRRQYNAAWLTRLTRTYGHESALAFAAERGYEVMTEETDPNGTIRLTLRRTAL